MAQPSIHDVLTNSLSPEAGVRSAATQQLESFAATAFPDYLQALNAELVNESAPSHIRNAAGLAIKNALTAREAHTKDALAQRWIALQDSARLHIKNSALGSLGSNDRGARNVAGQIIAAIAIIELPHNAWPDLIDQLMSFSQQPNASLKQATLQTIGYICEAIKPEILAAQSNKILTVVVQGARKEEESRAVQLAALHALSNSLDFIRENFERDGERNYIMQVVCEATQAGDADVQVAAFECLVKIMSYFYDFMQMYMEKALFGLTILGMKHSDERVALQAVEFWSTVCDEEIELSLLAEEAEEYNEEPERVSKHFAPIALPEILPVLLQLLMQQDEDQSDDEWNISMAAGTCLSLLAQNVRNGLVTPIIPFVESNIKNPDWHGREAAVMAFGSILDGPDPALLQPLVSQALPTLIEMMADPSVQVKDTTAWTLARTCDILVETIKPEVLPSLVTALMSGLADSAKVATNSAWGLMNLAEQLGDASKPTCPLSQMYSGIVDALLDFVHRASSEGNARTSGYEALSAYMTNAPADCMQVVTKVALIAVERAEGLLQVSGQLLGTDDKLNYEEAQMSLCGLMTAVIRRLGSEIKPIADRIMTLLLHLIQSAGKSSTILEDAFLCVGAMITTLEGEFEKYLQAFLPFLINALQSHQEYQLCSISVGLIGDISRALGPACQPYTQGFMEVLFSDLQSTVLHRSAKPPILSCFGDIALAVGEGFTPYLETTMQVLQQAGSMRADPDNMELVDYVLTLREAILEAYTGIVGAFKQAHKTEVLLNTVPGMLGFVNLALLDGERTEAILRAAVGLLGDLAEAFPNGQLRAQLQSEWVTNAVKTCRTRSQSAESKNVAKWAKEMIRRASTA